jgi:amidase
MTELAFLPAKRLAAMIKRREIGCVELLDHFIARVEKHDVRINAVVVRDFDRARALDKANTPVGPLHGVPMTVKESFDVAGLPTTWGVPEKRDDIAAKNALAVDRLLRAGAVVFGKTNVPRMLGDWQSFNEIYETTNNPWNVAYSPGGSSGGSAAALAAGLTGLETGSDIGGSIRQPAHACGVFGHKPTWGLLPTRGHAPVQDVASMIDIAVIGPLARSADDLSIAFDIMAGPDEVETEMRYALPAPRLSALKGLRVAVWAETAATHTDTEIVAALHALTRHLRREGAKVSLTAHPVFDPRTAFEVYLKLLSATLMAHASAEELARVGEQARRYDADDPRADAVMARSAGMSHSEWVGLNELRHRIRRAWGAFFHEWDVLLCPVHALPALPHRHEVPNSELRIAVNDTEIPWNDMLFWPGITCGYHLPASTAPLGMTRTGLPVGVQIVGPLYGDRTTLAVARMLERS